MKELVQIIAKSLVTQPEAVEVAEEVVDGTKHLVLTVAQEDTGKVIGRGGRIAKAIRTVVKAAAIKNDEEIEVDIR